MNSNTNLAVKLDNLPTEINDTLVKTLQSSLFVGAKYDSVIMAIEYCKQAKLDIMLKPIHIVPMQVNTGRKDSNGYPIKEWKDTIMPSINLYRIHASRNKCAGISEPEFGEDINECLGGKDITYPKWCKVTVKKMVNGEVAEFTANELWKENYANAGFDATTKKMKLQPNAMWSKRPYAQLAKCAEAQALRKAFPELGALYTVEEMEGKAINDSDHTIPEIEINPSKGISGLESKLGIQQNIEHDIETGEILDIPGEEVTDLDMVKDIIKNSLNLDELSNAIDLAKSFPEDEKKILRQMYSERIKEFKEKK